MTLEGLAMGGGGELEGYLVTFDFSKNRQATEPQWLEVNGKCIFEVII